MAVKTTGALAALLIAVAGCGPGPLEAVTVNPSGLVDGLVAHWTFDETGADTVAADRSGNRHDGQLTGGTWISSGQFGGALALASGDHVTVANFPQASVGWTVSVWIRISSDQLTLNSGSTDGWNTVLSTENVFMGGWQVYLGSRPGQYRFDSAYWAGTTNGSDYVVANCGCFAVGRWIHLTVVFDGAAREMRFYDGDTMADRQDMPIPILPGDPTLLMGMWNQTARFLAADLDDVAIWSRALDAAEVGIASRQAVPDPR
ncbi:MAG TPA: LamG domain-containing protein [Polyangia bacterium]